ncbi:MAG TPA: sigma-70 family RNA polymerase sigma factor [Actinomycetota bacterium]|nr:sigma-70 family RNA polymerase sigma factor [Actinomycetota bacterium]
MRSRSWSNDAALMRAFASREPAAAGELFDRFASRVYGLGVVMLGNDAAAEDLVQDTFVKLWRSAERYDAGRGKLETWVLLVARSLAIDALRRRVLDARTVERSTPASETATDPSPEELAELVDLSERARRAMSDLTPGQRAALELAYFGGKTSAEVAELEGIPLGTAKTRIRSALLKLRAALQEQTRDV